MKTRKGFYPQIFQCGVVPPQDGGLSLTPIESVIKGFRNEQDTLVLEMAGVDQVLHYGFRTNNYSGLRGSLMSHFPQAILSESVRNLASGSYVEDQERALGRSGDWLFLDEDEMALVQTVYLEYEPYLPLFVPDDRDIREGGVDPLAGVVGHLVSNTSGETTDGRGSDRFGLRVVLRPADERWGLKWQNRMQDRRDGEDRNRHLPQGEGPSTGTLVGLASLGALAFANYALWQRDMLGAAFAIDGAAVAALAGFVAFQLRRGGRRKRRPYIDERLAEEKLKALSYHCELQVVRVYRNPLDVEMMTEQIRGLVDALRAFDNSAGNSWRLGEIYRFDGQDILEGALNHPFRGGLKEVGFLDQKRADGCILSAREVASVWHLPLGTGELASMPRASSVVLLPYTPELNQGGPNAGPLVGRGGRNTLDVYLPDSALAKHTLIVGKSGTGKSTTLKHVLAYKFRKKAEGLDDGAVVVIDPHSDMVHELLELVPPSIAHKVRLLDFGRMDRVPAMNLVDPALFPDRDRCVDTIIQTVKGLWIHWGNRLEDLLRRSLTMVYEFNEHPDTADDEMLTMLDILPILEGGKRVGQGRDVHYVLGDFQRHVLSRVRDPRLHQWMEHNFLRWDPGERAQAVAPVNSRVGYYAQNLRASVVMGQRKSTIVMSDVLEEGQILLVATASGAVGKDPAALMGGTVVSLIDSALRAQESLPSGERKKCLVVCDEFQTVTGADWGSMLAEDRKYGGSIMLATQSLMRLDEGERHLRDDVLGNMGCFIAFKLSGEDSRIVSREMGENRVPAENFGSLDPYNCYVKVDSERESFAAFSMLSVPPPDPGENAAETVRLVLEQSVNYTVDWEESRRRIEADVRRQMELEGGGLELGGANASIGFTTGRDNGGGGGGRKGGGSSGEGNEAGAAGDGSLSSEGQAMNNRAEDVLEVQPSGNWAGGSSAGAPVSSAQDGEAPAEVLAATGVSAAAAPAVASADLWVDRAGEAVPEAAEGLPAGASEDGGAQRRRPGGTWFEGDPYSREGQEDEGFSLEGLGNGGDLLSFLSEGNGADRQGASGIAGGAVVESLDDDVRGLPVEGVDGPPSRVRREPRPAFDQFGRSPTSVIGDSSSLRGIEAWAIEESYYSTAALEELATKGDDPGVKAVFRKIFAGWHGAEMRREYNRGLRDGRAAAGSSGGVAPASDAQDEVIGPVGRRERISAQLGGVVDHLLNEEE